ncbi:MAG: dihydrolipoyl dehydrogenase [Candidatus Binatia bacterium]
MADNFDVVIIGGGPGGYVAAIRAAQLGLKVALVERDRLGGVCANWGCIPTKALLRASELRQQFLAAGEFGLLGGDAGFDLEKVVQRSRRVAQRLSGGVRHLLKKNGVGVIVGRGKLAGKGLVLVDGGDGDGCAVKELEAAHVILATGSKPRHLPGLEPDGRLVWSYREALVPSGLPASLLVVGAGAIGAEFASFYQAMGSKVTMVELMPRVLPGEDEEISELAAIAFEKKGIVIRCGVRVESLELGGDGVFATLVSTDGRSVTVDADRVISAVGTESTVEGLGLENTAVEIGDDGPRVDEWCRTDEEGVYAIGDLIGGPRLAHKAMHEAVLCVEKIAGEGDPKPRTELCIPACVYCQPQVASVGLTEAEAREHGYEVRVGRFPYAGNGRAVALGEAEGLVKTVTDGSSGKLLGAHMLGAEVTELIHGFVVALGLGARAEDLAGLVFPHPTLSETIHESVLAGLGKGIHY